MGCLDHEVTFVFEQGGVDGARGARPGRRFARNAGEMKGKSRVRTVRQIRVCSCVWVANPALPGILSTACDDSDWKTRVFVPNQIDQSSRAGKTRALCATSHRARTMSKGCMMARGDAPPCSPRGERREEADMEDLGLERGAL